MIQTVYVTRVFLIDGGVVDLMLFANRAEADRHAAYLRKAAPDLGYDRIEVMPRLVVGVPDEIPLADIAVAYTRVPRHADATVAAVGNVHTTRSRHRSQRHREGAAHLSAGRMVPLLMSATLPLMDLITASLAKF